MNKSILWNTVLIEMFAAVATIGLREQIFDSEGIKLVCICRMQVRGVIGNYKEKKKDITAPASRMRRKFCTAIISRYCHVEVDA